MTEKSVQTIPATVDIFTSEPINYKPKRRVAAYARVSTDTREQLTSYDAQIRYYRKLIKNHSGWIFCGIYTDSGITGTSTKHREGFKRMIGDALDGKIDLIITKSVSRFARNTVDSLTTIRRLKEHGVECYFEKENIRTFDSKGELLLTIMSSIAQEEARSVSENCIWSQRRRFAEGKVTVPFKRFLGYDRGADGNLVINPDEARLVRYIYGLCLKGLTSYAIAKKLTEEKLPAPSGKDKWYMTTVNSILTNEKYKGDALLQKTYTPDFLTKKKKINNGEVPKYYVKNNHDAIIPPEIFDAVCEQLNRQKLQNNRCTSIFSNKIKCGVCGGFCVPKVRHANDKYRCTVWQCSRKPGKSACSEVYINETAIKSAFVTAINARILRKNELAADFGLIKSIAPQVQSLPDITSCFDSELWLCTVEQAIIKPDKSVDFIFKGTM